MAIEMKMPKLSLTMTEGTIVEWYKQEGETITKGEPLVDITTDKVTATEEAPVDGLLLKIMAHSGTVVEVGKAIAIIGNEDEREQLEAGVDSIRRAGTTPQSEVRQEAAQQFVEKAVSKEKEPYILTPAARRFAREKGLDPSELEREFRGREKRVTTSQLEEWLAKRPKLTPLAAKAVQAKGINISDLKPREDGKRLTLSDIEERGNLAGLSETEVSGEKTAGTRKKIVGIRKLIAERMVTSKHTAPHVTLCREVDVEELEMLRAKINSAEDGLKVTVTDFCVLACAWALKRYPQANSSLLNEEIITWDQINIGVAAATPKGLMVPVVREADRLTLRTASKIIKQLAQKAREGKIGAEDLSGGTFTVSNLGMFRIDTFTPVINQPEAAILGVGRTLEKPVAWQGNVAIRKTINLSLSFDHRIMDGAEAAQFLDAICQYLEQPYRLIS